MEACSLMPTLQINGQNVEVGGEFLKLSPEEQQATVDEIAGNVQPPTDPRQSFGAGFGDVIPGMGYAAGALNYALQGGAPGSFDQGRQDFNNRLDQAQAAHPLAGMAGNALGLGVQTAIPVGTIPRAAEYALRGVQYGAVPAEG